MKVVVNGQYTYDTGLLKAKKGDAVVLPTPYFLLDVQGPTWEGTVTATKSDYNGPMEKVIKVIAKKA